MLKKISYVILWFFLVDVAFTVTPELPVVPNNNVQIPNHNALTNTSISASNMQIQAGIHYKKLDEKIRSNPMLQQLNSQGDGKVQILMFFSYGCAVCRRLNQPFDNWAKKQANNTNIEMSKIPVSFNYGWPMLAQAFYTAQALNRSDTLDEVIFSSIHEQSKPLWQEDKMEEVFIAHGVNKDVFKQMFHSFTVSNKVKWANDLSLAFGLANIPNIVIHGPYGSYVTNLVMTKDPQSLFIVIEHLVQKELKK